MLEPTPETRQPAEHWLLEPVARIVQLQALTFHTILQAIEWGVDLRQLMPLAYDAVETNDKLNVGLMKLLGEHIIATRD